MTIDELLAAAGLTANDEIPIWDAEATGEPTKKITAQNLAAAVVALANLVTGVKGNAEADYRHGDVNLTPADIGAMPINPHRIDLDGAASTNGGHVDFHYNGSTNFTSRIIETEQGILDVNGIPFDNSNRFIPVKYGGTEATNAADARTNLGIHYTDIFIPVDATEYVTDLSGSNSQILSVLHTNPMSSVCTIVGAQVINGVWYIFCNAVQVNTAQVRIFYVTV